MKNKKIVFVSNPTGQSSTWRYLQKPGVRYYCVPNSFFSGQLGVPWKRETIFSKVKNFFKKIKSKKNRKPLFVQLSGRMFRGKPVTLKIFNEIYNMTESLDIQKDVIYHQIGNICDISLTGKMNPSSIRELYQLLSDQIEEGYISHPVICKVY